MRTSYEPLTRRRFCVAVVSIGAAAARCGGGSITSPSATPVSAAPPGSQPPAETPPVSTPTPAPTDTFEPHGPTGTLPAITGTITGRTLRVVVEGTALATGGGVAQSFGDIDGTSKFVLLTRNAANQITAVSATCTHQGCIISRFEAPSFVCPCHGSQYAWTGEVTRGPATAALPKLMTEFDGRVVEVQL